MRNFIITMTMALALLACQTEKQYSYYQPLQFDGDGLVLKEVLLGKEHFDRVEHVLKHYDIKYKRTGIIEIKFNHTYDAEFMWNCTNKAENNEWLRTHPPIKGT